MLRQAQGPNQHPKRHRHIRQHCQKNLPMKFLITADIHGSITTWISLRSLMEKADGLVVAGDLFDTRYGSYGHPDFDPGAIRQHLTAPDQTLYYVYGNCDEPSFCPGHHHALTFSAGRKNIFLHHGSPKIDVPADADIIIQGHTHIWALEKTEGRIFMNPGSLARPRKGPATYGILDDTSVSILSLETGTPLMTLDI
jgi:uncharacterized protein